MTMVIKVTVTAIFLISLVIYLIEYEKHYNEHLSLFNFLEIEFIRYILTLGQSLIYAIMFVLPIALMWY